MLWTLSIATIFSTVPFFVGGGVVAWRNREGLPVFSSDSKTSFSSDTGNRKHTSRKIKGMFTTIVTVDFE